MKMKEEKPDQDLREMHPQRDEIPAHLICPSSIFVMIVVSINCI